MPNAQETTKKYKEKIDDSFLILKKAGINQEAVAKKLGMRSSKISKIKTGGKRAELKHLSEQLDGILEQQNREASTEVDESLVKGGKTNSRNKVKKRLQNITYQTFCLDLHEDGVQISTITFDALGETTIHYRDKTGTVTKARLQYLQLTDLHVLLSSVNADKLLIGIFLYLGTHNNQPEVLQGLLITDSRDGKLYSSMMILQKNSKPQPPQRDMLTNVPSQILHYLYNAAFVPDKPFFMQGNSVNFDMSDLEFDRGHYYKTLAHFAGNYYLITTENNASYQPYREASDKSIQKYPFRIFKNDKNARLECILNHKDITKVYRGKILNQTFNNSNYIGALLYQGEKGEKKKILFLLIFIGELPKDEDRYLGMYVSNDYKGAFDGGNFVIEKSSEVFNELSYEELPPTEIAADTDDMIVANYLVGQRIKAAEYNLKMFSELKAKDEFSACKFKGFFRVYFYNRREQGVPKGIAKSILEVNHYYKASYWGHRSKSKPLSGYIEQMKHDNLKIHLGGDENEHYREVSYYVKALDEKPRTNQIFTGVYASTLSHTLQKPTAGRIVLEFLGEENVESEQPAYIEPYTSAYYLIDSNIRRVLTGRSNNFVAFPRVNTVVKAPDELLGEYMPEVNFGKEYFYSACYQLEHKDELDCPNKVIAKGFERAIAHGFSDIQKITAFLSRTDAKGVISEILAKQHYKALRTLLDRLDIHLKKFK